MEVSTKIGEKEKKNEIKRSKISSFLRLDSTLKLLVFFLIVTYVVGNIFQIVEDIFDITEFPIEHKEDVNFGESGVFSEEERFFIAEKILKNYGTITSEEIEKFGGIYGENNNKKQAIDLLKLNLENYRQGNLIFSNPQFSQLNKNLNKLYSVFGNSLNYFLFEDDEKKILGENLNSFKSISYNLNGNIMKENCIYFNEETKEFKLKEENFCGKFGTILFLEQLLGENKLSFNFGSILDEMNLGSLGEEEKKEIEDFKKIYKGEGNSEIENKGKENFLKIEDFFNKNDLSFLFGQKNKDFKNQKIKIAKLMVFEKFFKNMNEREEFNKNLLQVTSNQQINEEISIQFIKKLQKEYFKRFEYYFKVKGDFFTDENQKSCFGILEEGKLIQYGKKGIVCFKVGEIFKYLKKKDFSLFNFKIDLSSLGEIGKTTYVMKKEINFKTKRVGIDADKNGIWINGFKNENGELIPIIRLFSLKEQYSDLNNSYLIYIVGVIFFFFGFFALYIIVLVVEFIQISILYIQGLKRKGYLSEEGEKTENS